MIENRPALVIGDANQEHNGNDGGKEKPSGMAHVIPW
jgi:hypothetical protein